MRQLAACLAFFLTIGASTAQEGRIAPQVRNTTAPRTFEGRRVALVIGNADYKFTPQLKNPGNDAADMAKVLRQLGFEVVQGLDLDKPGMDRTIRDFAEQLAGAHVALFFYSGHGLQVSGQNYLVPVDARLAAAAALDFEMVRLDLIHRTMEREASTNIIILDACRDNPLARNLARALGTRSTTIGRGLANVESGEGTLISFATQPGNVALDGEGRNSPFTRAFTKHIVAPGDDLPTILINVRNDVMQETARRQVPWEHSAMTARFYFTPPKDTLDKQMELAFWATVKDSTDQAVVGTYLDRYPNGLFAPLARALMDQIAKQQSVERALREEEARRIAAEQRRIEEERKSAEVRRLEDLRRLEEARVTEQVKQAEAQKNAEQLRRTEEQHKQVMLVREQELRKAQAEAKAARDAAAAAERERTAAKAAAEEAAKIAMAAATRTESEASKATPPDSIKSAALTKLPPPPASFDGAWVIQQSGDSGCFKPRDRWTVHVKNGVATAKYSGTVSASGAFSYRGANDAGNPILYSGTFRGNSGSGRYHVVGGTCSGTFTATRR